MLAHTPHRCHAPRPHSCAIIGTAPRVVKKGGLDVVSRVRDAIHSGPRGGQVEISRFEATLWGGMNREQDQGGEDGGGEEGRGEEGKQKFG